MASSSAASQSDAPPVPAHADGDAETHPLPPPPPPVSSHDAEESHETKPASLDLQDEDLAEYVEKYNKYIASYARRLKAKYFSKKALTGGDIFDHEVTVDDVVIKSSRWPCTRSFADPIGYFEDQDRPPNMAEETPTTSNKKYYSRKTC